MNSIEEYQNLIELFKQTLKFYAETDNYVRPPMDAMMYCVRPEFRVAPPSLIDKDCGAQARFIIQKAEELQKLNQEMQNEYDKIMSGYDQLQASGDIADVEKLKEIFKLMGNDGNTNI
jgi:hypothetical protein